MDTDPCRVCGGAELNLIDGFYYCVECGTQNTNVRETILELKTLNDGTFGISSRKRIVKIPKKTIQMSAEWYRWHAYNFILFGLAEELMGLGAKPSFKTKLLWIWTRYIKKYQNKEELGLNQENTDETNKDTTNTTEINVEEDNSESEDEDGCPWLPRLRKKKIIENSKRDIKYFSQSVILAMFYIALNLDHSDIQLSHLFRYIRENRLSLSQIFKFVPEEIDLKVISEWLPPLRQLSNCHNVRAISLTIMKELDLGSPIVPDLRKIADRFLTELCLPNDLKPLIYSLMQFRSCSFLDIYKGNSSGLSTLPDYENVVMSYVLVALKMCFGLDSYYENVLSDAVDKINEDRDYPKSFKLGKYSSPTDRLFSFREWCSYLQARKIMLCKYSLIMGEQHYLDIDDYVHMEHMGERRQGKRHLIDEIAMDLLKRMPHNNNIGVIPKEEFVPTLTPMSDYTEIIRDHCQDPEHKAILSEDFRQYSLNYACKTLELIDFNTSENLVKGVTDAHKTTIKIIASIYNIKNGSSKYVYVKNCDNKNWVKTKPPTVEHITREESSSQGNDKESDHGYDSEYTSNDKDPNGAEPMDTSGGPSGMQESIENQNNNTAERIDEQGNDDELYLIKEENEDRNIFDDSFEYLDLEEEKQAEDLDIPIEDIDEPVQNTPYDYNIYDSDSDMSCTSFNNFNPATFNRDAAIKELVLLACKKYKIPIPVEYKTVRDKPKVSKRKTFGVPLIEGARGPFKDNKNPAEAKRQIADILKNYHQHVEGGLLNRMQHQVNLAIKNANQNLTDQSADLPDNLTNPNESNIDITPMDDEGNATVNDVGRQLNEPNEETRSSGVPEADEDTESKLFKKEEMEFDHLIPKIDPNFDEKEYNVDQLYVKVKDEDLYEVFNNMAQDAEITDIISKKIEENKDCAKYASLKASKRKHPCKSDSEDDLPLSEVKEKSQLLLDLYEEQENWEPLIENDKVSDFKYWFRHYKQALKTDDNWDDRFDREIANNTPSSFYFVLKECTSILDCTTHQLYRNMQLIEMFLQSRS